MSITFGYFYISSLLETWNEGFFRDVVREALNKNAIWAVRWQEGVLCLDLWLEIMSSMIENRAIILSSVSLDKSLASMIEHVRTKVLSTQPKKYFLVRIQ